MNRTAPRPRQRQQGAVVILFAFSLVVLLAAGGLVLDLGHLYILKSELQNAADSAALAGAKEIDLSADGITSAVAEAKAFALQNRFDFSTPLNLADADISFGSDPDGPWVGVAAALANPSDKTFIRIDTGTKNVNTYLISVAQIDQVGTSGVAVAGRFVVDITPIGMCAVDPANRTSVRPTTGAGTVENELVEYGFRRGLTYDVLQMGAVGGSADPMLLNPVDSPPATCEMNHSSVNFTAPFLCQGNSTVANNSTEVYANTGVSAGPVEKAINSRFGGDYTGSKCQPETAPPDTNIHQFIHSDTGAGAPDAWMNPKPDQQALPFNASTGKPVAPGSTSTWGVLWSYSRAVRATGSAGNYSAGTPFEVADWSRLYDGGPAADGSVYPTTSPYEQTSGVFHETQSVHTASARRRVMNVALVDCSAETSNSMNCKKLPVVGVGKFFLQRKISLTTAPKHFNLEFAGLIDPVPNAEIKLYR